VIDSADREWLFLRHRTNMNLDDDLRLRSREKMREIVARDLPIVREGPRSPRPSYTKTPEMEIVRGAGGRRSTVRGSSSTLRSSTGALGAFKQEQQVLARRREEPDARGSGAAGSGEGLKGGPSAAGGESPRLSPDPRPQALHLLPDVGAYFLPRGEMSPPHGGYVRGDRPSYGYDHVWTVNIANETLYSRADTSRSTIRRHVPRWWTGRRTYGSSDELRAT